MTFRLPYDLACELEDALCHAREGTDKGEYREIARLLAAVRDRPEYLLPVSAEDLPVLTRVAAEWLEARRDLAKTVTDSAEDLHCWLASHHLQKGTARMNKKKTVAKFYIVKEGPRGENAKHLAGHTNQMYDEAGARTRAAELAAEENKTYLVLEVVAAYAPRWKARELEVVDHG